MQTTKEEFPIKGRYNCINQNIIYLLSCLKGGLQYIGQSGNTFNERFRVHLAEIKQGHQTRFALLHDEWPYSEQL